MPVPVPSQEKASGFANRSEQRTASGCPNSASSGNGPHETYRRYYDRHRSPTSGSSRSFWRVDMPTPDISEATTSDAISPPRPRRSCRRGEMSTTVRLVKTTSSPSLSLRPQSSPAYRSRLADLGFGRGALVDGLYSTRRCLARVPDPARQPGQGLSARTSRSARARPTRATSSCS